MEELLETIRAAIADDASPEARMTGAQACRVLLATLEPAAETPPPQAAAPAAPDVAAQIGHLAAALRGVPLDQLLDLAIVKLRAALPAGAEAPGVQPLNFRILLVPGRSR